MLGVFMAIGSVAAEDDDLCMQPTSISGDIWYQDDGGYTKVLHSMIVTLYIDGNQVESVVTSSGSYFLGNLNIPKNGSTDFLITAENGFIGNKTGSIECGDEKKNFGIEVYEKQGETPDMVSPTVVTNSEKPTGTDVSVTSKIDFTFNEAMNKASAENAFSISPQIEGTFSWNNNKMIFTPTNSLAYGTEYAVTISTGAKDIVGNSMQQSYTWRFTTEKEQMPGIPPGGGVSPGGGLPSGGEQPPNETAEQPSNETTEQPPNETTEQPADDTTGAAQPANEPESQQPGGSRNDSFDYILLILIIATIAVITYFIYLYYVKYKI